MACFPIWDPVILVKSFSYSALRRLEPLLYPFCKSFFGGRTREEALEKAERLNRIRRKVAINFLGEHITDIKAVRKVRREYLELLREIVKRKLDSTISIKLTQIGLDISRDVCEGNLKIILHEAKANGVGVEIDMEDSTYTHKTLDIVKKLSRKYPLRIALQAKLLRTSQDIDRLFDSGRNVHVRICKGAYEEARRVSLKEPFDIKINFLVLASKLFYVSDFPAIATHDEDLMRVIKRRFADKRESFEFQMLYGVRKDLQEKLVRNKYNVRIYIPYGKDWLHYGSRRWKEATRIILRR